MNLTKAPKFFLDCYSIMLLIMILPFIISLFTTGQVLFVPLESRTKWLIVTLLGPALISILITAWNFEWGVPT